MTTDTKRMLDLAARVALRAAGDVEPNPLVGAVIVKGDRIIGVGHHRRFGGPHAEAEALADCRRRGNDPAGATVYVTLEPCNAHGKQPPCSEALIAAGVARVVAARPDPHPIKRGGAERLRSAGIEVEFTGVSPLATRLADPFVKRLSTGLPWVIAKWAQTIDGRIATRTGESKWISGDAARHAVHRLRARVDAIVTGIGTVLADDPRLTARGVARLRRVARRVVIDPRLETPLGSALVRSARDVPLVIATTTDAMTRRAHERNAMEAAGAEVRAFDGGDGEVDIHALLTHLAAAHSAANVLVEAGAGVLGRLFRDDLVDEARVFIAPMLLGDERAYPAVRGTECPHLDHARRMTLNRVVRRGGDIEIWYRRRSEETAT